MNQYNGAGTSRFDDLIYSIQIENRKFTTKHQVQNRCVALSRRYSWVLRKVYVELGHCAKHGTLDLGCGFGNFAYYMSTISDGPITAVDSDQGQLDLIVVKRVNAVRAEMTKYINTCTEKSFGVISLIDSIEHLQLNETVPLLAQLRHILRDDGLLILRLPCAEGLLGSADRYNDLTHKWAATPSSIRGLILASGFASCQVLPEYFAPENLARAVLCSIGPCMRALTRVWLATLGIQPPVIFSRSMWVICRKRKVGAPP